MNKISKGLIFVLAGITVGTSTGLSTTFFNQLVLPMLLR